MTRSLHTFTILGFTRPFALSEFWFDARFRLNVAGLSRPDREWSSDESLEQLENPSEDKYPKLSFEYLACSLELELHVAAIILFNFLHTNERSSNAMLKPFDWINVQPLRFLSAKFRSKINSVYSCAGVQTQWER